MRPALPRRPHRRGLCRAFSHYFSRGPVTAISPPDSKRISDEQTTRRRRGGWIVADFVKTSRYSAGAIAVYTILAMYADREDANGERRVKWVSEKRIAAMCNSCERSVGRWLAELAGSPDKKGPHKGVPRPTAIVICGGRRNRWYRLLSGTTVALEDPLSDSRAVKEPPTEDSYPTNDAGSSGTKVALDAVIPVPESDHTTDRNTTEIQRKDVCVYAREESPPSADGQPKTHRSASAPSIVPPEWSGKLEPIYWELLNCERKPDGLIRRVIELLLLPLGHPQGAKDSNGHVHNGYSIEKIYAMIEPFRNAGKWTPVDFVEYIAGVKSNHHRGKTNEHTRNQSVGGRRGRTPAEIRASAERSKRSDDIDAGSFSGSP